MLVQPGRRWHGTPGGRQRRSGTPGTPSMAKALGQFTAAGLLAMLVLAAAGTTILRRDGAAEALREARVLTSVQEQAVRPHITDALVAGDRAALVDLDHAVRLMVLRGEVERVKVWAPDGRVLYADDARLIGERFTLGKDEARTLSSGVATSDVSDLSASENRLEPSGHRLLEVYARTQTPSGAPLLFETYLRYDSVIARGNRIWTDFAPALLATLLALQLLQLPLAWRLTRRLQDGQRERDILHDRVVQASDAERRRIAGDLHDGVVQTLAGVSFSLAAAAVDLRTAPAGSVGAAVQTISTAAELTRRSIGELRSLLVEIYPPNLREIGLSGALAGLLTSVPDKGVIATLSVPAGLELAPEVEELLYRATQEAVRNVFTHAQADHLDIAVHTEQGRAVLDVRDDGRGFAVLPQSDQTSHFGLRLLDEMTSRLDGWLQIDSVPGLGTTLHLEVPAR